MLCSLVWVRINIEWIYSGNCVISSILTSDTKNAHFMPPQASQHRRKLSNLSRDFLPFVRWCRTISNTNIHAVALAILPTTTSARARSRIHKIYICSETLSRVIEVSICTHANASNTLRDRNVQFVRFFVYTEVCTHVDSIGWLMKSNCSIHWGVLVDIKKADNLDCHKRVPYMIMTDGDE